MKQKQLDARFSKERKEDSHMAKRIREYDEITFMIEMVKCHYLGMIKMGKTKYHYNRYD